MVEQLQEMHMYSDNELVVKTLEDPDVYAYLIQRYQDKLLRYIQRISSVSREEAEDILQEAFIRVYTHLHDFDASLKFSSWIYRITYNLVISDYRKRASRGQHQSTPIDEVVINKIADDFDIQGELDCKVLQEKIDQVLQEMKPAYKDILILQFLEQKSYQEMSDILKKPIGTVGTLVNRAKKQFKKIAENQGIHLIYERK